MFRVALILLIILIAAAIDPDPGALALSIKRGKTLYSIHCQSCHQIDGRGLVGIYPTLVQSDYLQEDYDRAIRQIIYGFSGEMIVNGIRYNGKMDPIPLEDQQVADVMNYILNSWGNEAPMITEERVSQQRDQK